jgi:hypothetical protein
MMTHQCEKLQLGLFAEDEPCVVLPAARMVDLAALIEVLLPEIATALANGKIGDEQDHN